MKAIATRTPDPKRAMVRMFLTVALTAGLLFALAAMTRPANAQSASFPREDLVEVLGKKYDEKATALGVASNGGVIELFTTKDGATWTIVLTMPSGISTVIASGESWMSVAPLPGQVS